MATDIPEYDVLIASRTAPTYTGGLANYQHVLADALLSAMPGCRVGFLVFESAHSGTNPSREMPPNCHVLSDCVTESRDIWMRLASRPWLHGILEWLIRRAYQAAQSSGNGLPRARVIHYVGTGWDFFGFAAYHWARCMDARFTIFPAVHPGSWGDDQIDLRLYQRADMVICQSHHEIKHLTDLGLSKDRALRCGLPPMCRDSGDGVRFRERFQVGNRLMVLFAGRRNAEKGYPAICEAWCQVLAHHPDAKLVLAGPLEKGTSALQPNDAICDLGIPDDDTLADALAAADVLCLPSAHESFGLVYVEAWSYGKPVICGTAPASREWVRESEGGIFSDRDPNALAHALLTLLNDEPLRKKLGASGYDFQQRMLTRDKFVELHRKAFAFDT